MSKISLLPSLNIPTGDEIVVVLDGDQTKQARMLPLVAAAVAPFVAEAQQAAASVQDRVELIDRAVRSGAGRVLYRLKKALSDPLHQYVAIVLIGDSITQGMSVTGGGDISPYPRTGTLADARNNATSPTWANLLHGYLGLEYYDDDSVTAAAWPACVAAATAAGLPASAAGVAIFDYRRTVNLYPEGGDFITDNIGGLSGPWRTVPDSAALLGFQRQFIVDSSSDRARIAFPFVGHEFDFVFSATALGARYELFLNGENLGLFSTQTGDTGLPTGYRNVRTHDFGSLARGQVELRVVPGDIARYEFRAEAIRINRRLRVTNQGIIGTTAENYVSMLDDAVSADDQFALVQLGTNDRALTFLNGGVPASPARFQKNLTTLVRRLQDSGVEVILACANAVTDNSAPVYVFTMTDVRGVIAQVADQNGCDMIDHYGPTRALLATGDTGWLADGTHPGDVGHSAIYHRIKAAIDGSMAR